MIPSFAYLSSGKLYVRTNDGSTRQIESPFGAELVRNAQEIHKRHEWKLGNTAGAGTPFSGGMLWGRGDGNPAELPIGITAVTVANPEEGELLYFLETNSVGAILRYNCVTGEEKRLSHREGFHATDLARNSRDGRFVYSQRHANGVASLMVAEPDFVRMNEVTEGDTVDEAPTWVAGSDNEVVYHSSGVARNTHGHYLGLGPSCIQQLDLATGRVETLVQQADYDCMLPRKLADGNLYYLRRPHEFGGPKRGVLHSILDALLFPFRLFRAVLYFLNFFSEIFAKKPLITSVGQRMQQPQQAGIMFRGRVVDTERAMRKAAAARSDVAALVPSNWELVRRAAAGAETVLAKGVASYDLAADGGILYTNGRAIYALDRDGKSELLHKDKLVQEVKVLE